MKYYVIYCDEDGDKTLTVYTKEKLEQELKEMAKDTEYPPVFGDPETVELDSFSGMIIIKGEAVIPEPVDVVKSYGI